MKNNLLEVATKKRVFAEITVLNKTLLITVLLAPLIIVTAVGLLVNSGLSNVLGIASISTVSIGAPTATITVDEPVWYSNHSAHDAGRVVTTSPFGYAPFPVFFQGWQSLPRNEIVDYHWNFGDSHAYAGNPNELTGFNSAHVFEQPGNYTVTLTVKNRQGQTSQATMTVTVADRTTYPNAKTYYVAPDGNDTYTGLCQTAPASGNCGPWRTAQKAFDMLHASVTPGCDYFYCPSSSVLFKRGGSYPITTTYPTSSPAVGVSALLFGAYGTGAKPIIQYNGTTTGGGSLMKISQGSQKVSFVDLDIRGKNPDVSARLAGVITGAGRNKGMLFLRVEASDLQSQFFGFSNPGGTWPAEKEAVPTGVFMFDTTIKLNFYGVTPTDPNWDGSDMLYGYFGNLALVGNTFDKPSGHITYLSHLNKAVIVNNTFSRPAFGRDALRIDGSLVNGQGTNNVYIADNYILGWRDPLNSDESDSGGPVHNGGGLSYNYQLINIGPNGPLDQFISYVTFERNIVTNFEWAMKIADADNVIVRNNLFVAPNLQSVIPGVITVGDTRFEKRPNRDIYIVGNTFAIQSKPESGHFGSAAIYISPYNTAHGTVNGNQHQNINILNNLIYRPANTSIYVMDISGKVGTLLNQLHFDGNLYSNQTTINGKMFKVGWDIVYKYTLEEWRDLKDTYPGGDFDLNSQASSSAAFASLLFNQTPTFFVNAPGAPFTLDENLDQANAYKEMFKLNNNSTNPAIDYGVDVRSYLSGDYLPFDFSGNARPDGSLVNGTNYDVGAYEISKTPVQPPPDDIIPCEENWTCTPYLPTVCDASRIQTRICSDDNYCGTVVNKPAESQSCTYIPPCDENWFCTDWSTCSSSGSQARACTDRSSCGTTTTRPILTQGCSRTCSPNWVCTAWPACTSSGQQSRTCSDSNNCNITTGKPAESQSCTYNGGGGGGGGTPPDPNPNPTPAASIVVSTQGSIIKVNATDRPAVYYVIGGKKYLFVNRVTYTSWSANAGDGANNFSTLKKISQAEFDNIPTGGNLVVKATWLIKFDDSPIMYAVGSGGKLYKLADLAAQRALFGIYIPVVIQSGFRDNYYNHGNSLGTLTASSQMPQ